MSKIIYRKLDVRIPLPYSLKIIEPFTLSAWLDVFYAGYRQSSIKAHNNYEYGLQAEKAYKEIDKILRKVEQENPTFEDTKSIKQKRRKMKNFVGVL